jgi:hypothetical protein
MALPGTFRAGPSPKGAAVNRRAVLLSTLAFALAKLALARPPFTLSGDPVPLPSLPFKDGEGRSLLPFDFSGRVCC